MSERKKNTGSIGTVVLLVFFFAGLSLLLYPTVSNYWNSFRQTRQIDAYEEELAVYTPEQYEEQWGLAEAFNASVSGINDHLLTDEQQAAYDKALNIGGKGLMGYIDIPSVNITLPIYHGTSTAVLQTAIGHVEWSSLPTGGEGTHCVLSGHRGLPSAKLFTDLDKLAEGDIFTLNILDKVLTYKVDRILIVEPDDIRDLQVEEGKDYCTLVTCTPYGINTQRLLVRGHRIETEEAEQITAASDALQIDPMITGAVIFVPVLAILLTLVWLDDRRNENDPDEEENDDETD